MRHDRQRHRSHLFRQAREALGLRHLPTRPYTPETSGKAERFIKTLLEDRAYTVSYRSSAPRSGAWGKKPRLPPAGGSGAQMRGRSPEERLVLSLSAGGREVSTVRTLNQWDVGPEPALLICKTGFPAYGSAS